VKIKGKVLSIGMVLLLVLSLAAVIPAGFAGAATAGTAALSRTVYSLSADTGTDSFAATSAFSSVKFRVTDADLNVARTGKARYTLAATTPDDTTTFDINKESVAASGDPVPIIGGEVSKTQSFNGDASAVAFDLTLKGRDANDDGALTIADVSVKVGGVTATVASVATSGSGAYIDTVTLAAAPAAGTDNVVVSFEVTDYDITTPANTPISLTGTSISFGATFATATSSKTIDSIDATAGTISATSAVVEGASKDYVVVTFAYNVIETITSVPVKSDTTLAAADTRTITLTETSASSGVYEGSIELEAATGINIAKLQVANGDTITATYTDASPSASVEATAIVDLTPPTITLVEPTNSLVTKNTTPSFSVEVTDAVSPITSSTGLDLTIDGSGVAETKTAIVNGYRLSFLQSTAFTDKAVEWFVTAKDAVGNNVAGQSTAVLGSTDKKFKITVDTSKVASISSAKAGFGVNAAGTERTRSDNTGIEVTFSESLDGTSVAASDFDVTGSSAPNSAQHFATLKNTETFTGDASATTFTITEFAAVDTDSDGVFPEEYTVSVAGTVISANTANATSVTMAAAPAAAATVKVTYTYSSKALVYLTVDALGPNDKPVVTLVGDVLDLAGNSAVASIKKTSVDDINPTITVSAASTLVADPDNDVDATTTITITSDEPLASAPTPASTATTGTDGGSFGSVSAVTGSTTSWTTTFTSTTTATYSISATGTDKSANSGTSGKVEVKTDVTDPALSTEAGVGSGFDPAAVATGATANKSYQGLDNISRAVANYGEATTVVSSTLDGTDVSADTFAEGSSHILAKVMAEGTYTWKISVQDAAGNLSTTSTLVFSVAAPSAYTVAIEPGWNLISVPSRLAANTLSKVFGDTSPTITKVRTWTSTGGWEVASFKAGAWAGDLTNIKPGLGYWAFSSSAADLKVTLRRVAGIPSATAPQTLEAGWSLIGIQFLQMPTPADTSMDAYLTGSNWSAAYSFDPDPAVGFTRYTPKDEAPDTDKVKSGAGYWVYSDAGGKIIP
jgi:hypothetical protein